MIRLRRPQARIFASPHRFRVLVAGRRFGKTYLAAVELLRAAWMNHGIAWYVAPTYKQGRHVAWSMLKQLTKPYWASKPSETDLRIELEGGGVIALRGADNYDALRGEGIDFLVLDEYASMAPEAWTEVLRPMLADRQGKALFIGTPQGFNHFYDLYTAVQTDPDWATFQYTTEEGGNISVEELTSAAQQLSARVYQQEFCAKFESLTSGRAYYAFDRDRDVRPVTYDSRYPLVWALDFNVNPGCSLLCQIIPTDVIDPAHRATLGIPESRVQVLKEIVLPDSNTYEVCQEFVGRTEAWAQDVPQYFKLQVEVYGDSTGDNHSTTASRTDWEIVKSFLAKHADVYEARFHYATRNPLVKDRVNCVNAMFCDAQGRRRVIVSPDNRQLIRDLEQVAWKQDANGNSTAELNKADLQRSHLSDALGYFLAQKFAMLPKAGLRRGFAQ